MDHCNSGVRVQSRVRVRQHVNPLSRGHQVAHGALDWHAHFADPSLPLVVDVGCGYGRFAIKWAHERPNENVLGLEIRPALVTRAVECVPATVLCCDF